MPTGRYDAECIEVQKKTWARATILIVLDGVKGSGFSLVENTQAARIPPTELVRILRELANELEDRFT